MKTLGVTIITLIVMLGSSIESRDKVQELEDYGMIDKKEWLHPYVIWINDNLVVIISCFLSIFFLPLPLKAYNRIMARLNRDQ